MSDSVFTMAVIMLFSVPILKVYSVLSTKISVNLFLSLVISLILGIYFDSSMVFCIGFTAIFCLISMVKPKFFKKNGVKAYIVLDYCEKTGMSLVTDCRANYYLPLMDEYEKGSVIYVKRVNFDVK